MKWPTCINVFLLNEMLQVDFYHLRASADGLLEPDGFLVFDEVLGLGGGIFSPS